MVKAEYNLHDAQRDLQAQGMGEALPIANNLATAAAQASRVGAGTLLFALYGPESVRPEGVTTRFEAIEQRFRRDLSKKEPTPIAWFRKTIVGLDGVTDHMEGFGLIKHTSLQYDLHVLPRGRALAVYH